MSTRYGKRTSEKVARTMREFKEGKLRSGSGGTRGSTRPQAGDPQEAAEHQDGETHDDDLSLRVSWIRDRIHANTSGVMHRSSPWSPCLSTGPTRQLRIAV
jgi:hypothetical protein